MPTFRTTPPRETKAAILRRLLARMAGTNLAALQSATGWQPHSVRAGLSGLRKAGYTIERADMPPNLTMGPSTASPTARRCPMTPLVTELETMDRAALIAAWSEIFGTPVPKRLSSPFLRRFLAFEIQARQFGGRPKGFAEKLVRAANDKADTKSPALKPGGRLIREWNGVTHAVDVVDVVDVVEGGFIWDGQRHSSLSAIARAITGARWSGPRFFGLKKPASR